MRTTAIALCLCLATAGAAAQSPPADPLPPLRTGDAPEATGTPGDVISEADLERLAAQRGYEAELRSIARRFLSSTRPEARVSAGLDEIREFTDPAAFRPMWRVLREHPDPIRLAVLDHLLLQGDQGQGALAWIAINETGDDELADENRYEALRRLVSPPSQVVLNVLDASLRSDQVDVANGAGMVAGAVNALEAIPLMIFAQSGFSPSMTGEGDLAWILVGRQTAYIRALVPIVNNGAVAFQPIPGVLTEGFVLRVVDAVVIIYRTIIHRVLVTMTTNDWGQSTEHLAYDIPAWMDWYNNEYRPYKLAQLKAAELAAPPPPPS